MGEIIITVISVLGILWFLWMSVKYPKNDGKA